MSFLDSLSMNLFDSPMITNNKKSSSSSSSSPTSNKTNQQERREGNSNHSSFSNRSYEHYRQKINIDVFHGAQKSMDSVSSSYTNHPSREKNPSYYMEFHHNEEDHHKTRKQQGDEMSMNGGRSPISSSPYDKDHNELENEEEGVQSPFQRTKAVARTDVVIADKVAVPRDHSFSSSSAYFSSSIQDEAENQQDEEMQKQNYDDQKEQMLIISKTNQQDEMAASCFTAAVATNTSPMPPPPAADHFLNTSFTINIMAEEYLNPRMEEITKMIHEVEGYLDDLYDVQIKNAVLMDDLVMAGANF